MVDPGFFFFQAEDGIRDLTVTGVQTCALPISILTVNLAPTDSSVIWVGTDDGLVQVTRDGGKTWSDVSGHFPALAKDAEGRVYQIGISPFDAGTAYLAADRHELDDRRPYLYKTAA